MAKGVWTLDNSEIKINLLKSGWFSNSLVGSGKLKQMVNGKYKIYNFQTKQEVATVSVHWGD